MSANLSLSAALHLNAAGQGLRSAYLRRRAGHDARQRVLALSNVVKEEIIPKLKLLHPRLAPSAGARPATLTAEQVAQFANLVLEPEMLTAQAAFQELLAKGHATDALFLHLLAPAAALLGRLWDEDLCDFTEVTTGVARLQMLLSSFEPQARRLPEEDHRHVLMMAAPGEQHTFGLALVEQFLRDAGWHVTSGLGSSAEEIGELIALHGFEVIGLTLSCESRLEALSQAIRGVRAASQSRTVGVMVGGPAFLARPELVERVGADASAVDAPTTVLLAQRLLDIARADRRTPGIAAPTSAPEAGSHSAAVAGPTFAY